MTGGGMGYCAIPLQPVRPAYTGRRFITPYGAPWDLPNYGLSPYTTTLTREDKIKYLKELAESMREDLKEIEQRIKNFEAKES
jgi:hypothetical protein